MKVLARTLGIAGLLCAVPNVLGWAAMLVYLLASLRSLAGLLPSVAAMGGLILLGSAPIAVIAAALRRMQRDHRGAGDLLLAAGAIMLLTWIFVGQPGGFGGAGLLVGGLVNVAATATCYATRLGEA